MIAMFCTSEQIKSFQYCVNQRQGCFLRGSSLEETQNELLIGQKCIWKVKTERFRIIIFRDTSIYPDDDLMSKTFGFSFSYLYFF